MKEMTKGEMLKEKGQALKKIKLIDAKTFWSRLEQGN